MHNIEQELLKMSRVIDPENKKIHPNLRCLYEYDEKRFRKGYSKTRHDAANNYGDEDAMFDFDCIKADIESYINEDIGNRFNNVSIKIEKASIKHKPAEIVELFNITIDHYLVITISMDVDINIHITKYQIKLLNKTNTGHGFINTKGITTKSLNNLNENINRLEYAQRYLQNLKKFGLQDYTEFCIIFYALKG